MAFQVSPGVQVKEIDATNVIPAVSTNIGGFAGSFNWGPAGEVCMISSENGLVEKFGKPDNNTFKYFLVAASFLKYGNALKVVRVVSGHDNATADGTGQLIKNEEDYDNNYRPVSSKNFLSVRQIEAVSIFIKEILQQHELNKNYCEFFFNKGSKVCENIKN